MPSFEHVNFNLRPNKNIERKLIGQLLADLTEAFPVPDYRYIGMGSMWFVDFKLLHRRLDIDDMVSIERAATDRAEYNKPFDCITVAEGEASRVLRDAIDLEEERSVIWLDYDSRLDGPAISDLRYVASKVPSGSIVAATINAHHGQLRNQKDSEGHELDKREALDYVAGPFVPAPLDDDALNRKGFPHTACQVLFNAMEHEVQAAGRPENVHRLLGFSYSDNAPMVTVGVMVADDEDGQRLRDLELDARRDYITHELDAEPFTITVPPLTSKEKIALDQLLPRSTRLTEEVVKEELDFSLKQAQLDSYRRFYRQYPVFGELVL